MLYGGFLQYKEYILDSFQERAVKAVDEGKSLIVSAPTGCGKTLIAEYAVEFSLKLNHKIIYTAPIKALSNQKFRDFRKLFGDEIVGIYTGDVTINPRAPLLIMTTEIFRNLVMEGSSRLDDIYYVIFDEIHFLDDEERGTVWEECIILAPPKIHFICLSATVPNIEELADWMNSVREEKFIVIKEERRPVPLKHYLYSAKYGLMNLKGVRKKYKKNFNERKKFFHRKPSSKRVISHVLKRGNFPVLYFCFNRRACERNAKHHTGLRLLTKDEKIRLHEMVDNLICQYKLEGYDRLGHMRYLWESGCAYHHAGILPAAKEIVERLFTTGLIKLLFCTETFALGVNMPASAVIFDELEKFNGIDFEYLSTRQYNQMAGRAGRRGMDEEGYVYSQIIPETTDPKEIERILYHKNEKIESRFFASYSTILNLYSKFGKDAFGIFRKSLRNYKKGRFIFTGSYRREEEQIRKRIKFLQATGFLYDTRLTKKGKLASAVNGYEIQVAELYTSRSLDECTPEQLCIVLAALVTEEKERKIAASDIKFNFRGKKVIHKLHQMEIKYNIEQPIREMNFALAAPIFSWANGCSLAELESFGVPEGDLIRVMRMSIQLIRTLWIELEDTVLSDRMHEALGLLNRGVVDAQAELKVD